MCRRLYHGKSFTMGVRRKTQVCAAGGALRQGAGVSASGLHDQWASAGPRRRSGLPGGRKQQWQKVHYCWICHESLARPGISTACICQWIWSLAAHIPCAVCTAMLEVCLSQVLTPPHMLKCTGEEGHAASQSKRTNQRCTVHWRPACRLPARLCVQVFEAGQPVKCQPLAHWTFADCFAYLEAHNVPAHPLHAQVCSLQPNACCTHSCGTMRTEPVGRSQHSLPAAAPCRAPSGMGCRSCGTTLLSLFSRAAACGSPMCCGCHSTKLAHLPPCRHVSTELLLRLARILLQGYPSVGDVHSTVTVPREQWFEYGGERSGRFQVPLPASRAATRPSPQQNVPVAWHTSGRGCGSSGSRSTALLPPATATPAGSQA